MEFHRESKCVACGKTFSNASNLKAHHIRQPLCKKWIDLLPGATKNYIDEKFGKEDTCCEKTCCVCSKQFSSVGNLNKHFASSVICNKWLKFTELDTLSHGDNKSVFHDFEPSKDNGMCHIIWNILLTTKTSVVTKEMLREANVTYVLAILPTGSTCDIADCIMSYDGHTTDIDIDAFRKQCDVIEEHRARRENILLFCNNGYQRSIPFLCYYLTKFHPSEVPTIGHAVDLVLSQIDKENFASLRDGYTRNIESLDF